MFCNTEYSCIILHDTIGMGITAHAAINFETCGTLRCVQTGVLTSREGVCQLKHDPGKSTLE